jgi:hypothetical protein
MKCDSGLEVRPARTAVTSYKQRHNSLVQVRSIVCTICFPHLTLLHYSVVQINYKHTANSAPKEHAIAKDVKPTRILNLCTT